MKNIGKVIYTITLVIGLVFLLGGCSLQQDEQRIRQETKESTDISVILDVYSSSVLRDVYAP